jgi:hypothetical protein
MMPSKIKPPLAAGPNRSHPLADRLAGCWLFNEGAGQVVYDVSGQRHPGAFSGGPQWLAAPFGAAVAFDGNNDWISMGDCLDLGTDDITVLALVRYDAASQPEEWSGSHFGAIVGKGYLDTAKGYGLLVDTSNRIFWQVRNLATVFTAGSDAALNDGQWHILVGVCDRDSSTGVRLYVDGVRQSATADPTGINGIDLSGARAFAIGSRQHETDGTWYWDFAGRVAAVSVWKRVLLDTEIAGLQRDPFGLFTRRRPTARRAVPTGSVVDLAGRSDARATAVAVLRKAGSTRAWAARPWLREVLLNGLTANAFKLGTVLTQGWFWVRRRGCAAVYRGDSPAEIDLGRIVHVADAPSGVVTLPAHLPHPPGSAYCYLVRRFNGCGGQEQTHAAQVCARIGADGQLAEPLPNAVLGLKSEQAGGGRLRLTWFYCSLDQEAAPEEFNIYWDSGTGQIDREHALATVPYAGRRFYQHETAPLGAGRYTFVVCPGNTDHVEGASLASITCAVSALAPEAATLLAVQAV